MKPTQFSVTEIACNCGYLARSVTDPQLPIKFDAQVDEYYFEHVFPTGNKLLLNIYHCPMCGGVASQSTRDTLFAVVTDQEAERLHAMIQRLTTAQEIQTAFGDADEDKIIDPATQLGLSRSSTMLPFSGPIRVLTYTRLSETADVQFMIASDGKVESTIAPKYIGSGKTGS
jgi:hypothetical protein